MSTKPKSTVCDFDIEMPYDKTVRATIKFKINVDSIICATKLPDKRRKVRENQICIR